MLLGQLAALATTTTSNVMEAGIAHALPGMVYGAAGLRQQHAQLLAVLEQLSEQGHALIQALIYAAMLVQVMILIMAEGRAMSALQPADGAAMVDFQAGPLHAAVQLDPKRGLAAQELLVLDIVLEA